MKSAEEIARECFKHVNFKDDDYDETDREEAILRVSEAILAERKALEEKEAEIKALHEATLAMRNLAENRFERILSLESQLLAQAKVLERMRKLIEWANDGLYCGEPHFNKLAWCDSAGKAISLPASSAEEEVRLMEKVVQTAKRFIPDNRIIQKERREIDLTKDVDALEAFRSKGGGA
jgi:hypothetical protein